MKKLVVFLLLTVMIISVTGCQKTPEASVVVNKSGDALMEKASADTGEGTLAEKISAPETYQNTISSEDGLLNLTIDAAVTVPEAESVPLIRVTSAAITQEQADVILEALVHNTLYALDRELTKEEIMEQILAAREELAMGTGEDEEYASYYIDGVGESTWEEWMEYVIDGLYEQYDAAPSAADLEPVSSQFVQSGGDYNIAYIMGSGTSDAFGYEELRIYNTPGLGGSTAYYYRNTAKNDYEQDYQSEQNLSLLNKQLTLADFPVLTITEDEAIALCDELVAKLGISQMTCYSVSRKYNGGYDDAPPRCCWELQYTRCLEGLPITYTSSTGEVLLLEDDGTSLYQEAWQYETLTFYVNDDGIVGMSWAAPYELGETVSEDAALLSFSEAMTVFENMYMIQMDGQKLDVTISDIRLGYMRIREQDSQESGLLVPVWDFFGVVTDKSGDTAEVSDDPACSLLTINAIDGSIIDRDIGY